MPLWCWKEEKEANISLTFLTCGRDWIARGLRSAPEISGELFSPSSCRSRKWPLPAQSFEVHTPCLLPPAVAGRGTPSRAREWALV